MRIKHRTRQLSGGTVVVVVVLGMLGVVKVFGVWWCSGCYLSPSSGPNIFTPRYIDNSDIS